MKFATKRLIKPWIQKRVAERDFLVFSMDDEEYGKEFVNYNFGNAINDEIISDYRILIMGTSEKEGYQQIKKDFYLSSSESDDEIFVSTAQLFFRQLMLVRAMKEYGIKKVITYHSSIRNAQEFIEGYSSIPLLNVFKEIWPGFNEEGIYLDHINGTMSAAKRKLKLNRFANSEYGVISNVRCLVEGIDVPEIDCVYFVEPKRSLIDIIQACGRALRKNVKTNEKIAYFLIPIILPEGNSEAEIINNENFETVFHIIQALRDQDSRLAEMIDEMNLAVSQGRPTRLGGKESYNPLVVNLPSYFDISVFSEALHLKIADVNKDPTSYGYRTKVYGKKARKSFFKRVFKTLGDYSVESYEKSLVIPTIEKYQKNFTKFTNWWKEWRSALENFTSHANIRDALNDFK